MLSKLKGIDIAFYIFLLTGLGYLVTYLYQWGYNNYFSIPASFIELSVTSITKSITLLGIFFASIMLNVLFFEDKTDLKTQVKKLISVKSIENKKVNFTLQTVCLIGILYFFSLWYVNEQATKINYLGMSLVFFLAYCFLKKYKMLILVSWTLLMFMLPYMVGVTHAMKQNEFYIIDNKANYLIINFYDDKAIAAKYNKRKRIIYTDFKLISVDSLANGKKQIKLVKINKLKVNQVSTLK